jgi:aspartate carbamoyltransferase catalytic subunit
MPKHLVSSKDLTKEEYLEIIRRFDYFMEKGISPDLMRGKIVATLFFQPSTRTMNCFQSGMLRAGGGWIGVTGTEGLSLSKGESWEDTVREYSNFSDCIALRHPDDDSAERAAKVATVPIINGGSGSREHAVGTAMMLCNLSHALKKYNKSLKGAKFGLYGTPEINRVSKALVPILGFWGIELFIDDLGHFPLPKEVEEAAKKNGIKNIKYDRLDNFIGKIDALIVTRGLQKGIIPADKFPKEKEEMILKLYKPITKEHMKRLPQDSVLYMITPLIFEIERDVDPDPRALYSKPHHYSEIALAVMTYLMGVKV